MLKSNMQERKELNIVIRDSPEKPHETPLSLAKEMTEFSNDHFSMPNVNVFGVSRLGKQQEGDGYKRAIVCSVMDTRKRDIILDCS